MVLTHICTYLLLYWISLGICFFLNLDNWLLRGFLFGLFHMPLFRVLSLDHWAWSTSVTVIGIWILIPLWGSFVPVHFHFFHLLEVFFISVIFFFPLIWRKNDFSISFGIFLSIFDKLIIFYRLTDSVRNARGHKSICITIHKNSPALFKLPLFEPLEWQFTDTDLNNTVLECILINNNFIQEDILQICETIRKTCSEYQYFYAKNSMGPSRRLIVTFLLPKAWRITF